MEKILVPVVEGEKDIWRIHHGLQLASRIGGTVVVLEIDETDGDSFCALPESLPHQLLADLATAAQEKEKEVHCEYYHVTGDFCNEIKRFVDRWKITTLVLELSSTGKKTSPAAMLEMVNALRMEKRCRVELVRKK